MLAAEAAFAAIGEGRSGDLLTRYETVFEASPIARDLRPVRNVKPLLSRFGTIMGTVLGGQVGVGGERSRQRHDVVVIWRQIEDTERSCVVARPWSHDASDRDQAARASNELNGGELHDDARCRISELVEHTALDRARSWHRYVGLIESLSAGQFNSPAGWRDARPAELPIEKASGGHRRSCPMKTMSPNRQTTSRRQTPSRTSIPNERARRRAHNGGRSRTRMTRLA
jgi:hypothetical protein